MTIEERARELATWTEINDGYPNEKLDHQVYNACVRIANEQRRIDDERMSDALFIQHQMLVEKACRLWHKNILKAQITEEEFRKSMEE